MWNNKNSIHCSNKRETDVQLRKSARTLKSKNEFKREEAHRVRVQQIKRQNEAWTWQNQKQKRRSTTVRTLKKMAQAMGQKVAELQELELNENEGEGDSEWADGKAVNIKLMIK